MARLGDPHLGRSELLDLGPFLAARHFMILLARARPDSGSNPEDARKARADGLEAVVDSLWAIANDHEIPDTDVAEAPRRRGVDFVRGVLSAMDSFPIVRVYPLEVMTALLERRADLFADVAFGCVVENKTALEAQTFSPGERIELHVPLAAKLRSFALEGGGSPGYRFAPGPPARYFVGFGCEGVFTVLVRALVRHKNLVDRLVLRVEGARSAEPWC